MVLFSEETYHRLASASRERAFNYKTVLASCDLFVAFGSFFGAAWLSDLGSSTPNPLLTMFHIALFSVIMLSFFPSAKVYSHHLIFGRRNHAKAMAWAMYYGGLTILLIVLIYLWPQVLSSQIVVPLLFLCALALLILSRFISGQFMNVLQVLGISFIATGVFGLLDPVNTPAVIMNWQTLLVAIILMAVVLAIVRYTLVHHIFCNVLRRRFRRQILIVGHNPDTEKIANYIVRKKAPYWIGGTVASENDPGMSLDIPKAKLGQLTDIADILHHTHLDEIIVTDPDIDKSLLIELIDFCTSVGIDVWMPPKIMAIIDVKLYVDKFCGIGLICLRSTRNDWLFNKIKHAVDGLISLPLLIFLLPVFTLIAVAIKAESTGPVFYRPQVVGKGGRLLSMFKFRTMLVDSDSGTHKEYVSKLIRGEIGEAGSDDQILKITDDPRVTRVGRFLRQFSLDELPQIINVVKGEMSLVGPRPCLIYEYELYKDWHKKRTKIRPGISGLWQVTGRSNVAFDDMILLDLYYVYNRNLLMDLNTLYETVFAVLQKKGAY